jgi:hypothetical protein
MTGLHSLRIQFKTIWSMLKAMEPGRVLQQSKASLFLLFFFSGRNTLTDSPFISDRESVDDE